MSALAVKEANYQPIIKPVVSKVEYTRIIQQSGGSSFNIGTSSSESIFELPARVMNLARSHLKFKMVVPDPGATVNVNWMWHHEGGIRQIQLYTRGGTMLCDLSNLQQYLSVVTCVETKKNDCQTIDDSLDDEKQIKFSEVASDSAINYRSSGALPQNNLHEKQYLYRGEDTTATEIFVDINLSLIKNTIFALDKSLYFNETVLIKVIWGERDSWGFVAPSLTVPQTNAAVLTGDIALSDCYLYLALERNPLVSAAVIDKVLTEGLTINCPYVYSFKHVPSGTSQSVTIRLNRSNGSHLKKVYHSLFNAAETLATRYRHDIAATTTSHYTSLNNQRLQQFDLKNSDRTDYMYHYDEILRDSMISTFDSYKYNWFHCDKFEEQETEDVNDNIVSGVPLDVEQKWDFTAVTANTAYKHFTFAICNRMLIVSGAGIVFA